MKKENKYLIISVLIFVSTLFVKRLFQEIPFLYEKIYLNGIYRLIRVFYDYLIGSWLPFPMVILSILFIFYMTIFRKTEVSGFIPNAKFIISRVLILLSLFYFAWGFNYSQQGISERLKMDNRIKADSTRLVEEANWVIRIINEERTFVQNDTLVLAENLLKIDMFESEIREELEETLTAMHFPVYGKPKVRIVSPKGILMRFKTAGIYFPYAFEGHIDNALMNFEKPFTLAHEMSHGYGVTDEGECNFTAFVACMQSGNHYYRYSAMIDYTLYVLRDLYRFDPALHKEYYQKLLPGVKKDIKSIRENNKRYPDILPSVRDALYNSYLKSNGISAGLSSYSQLVSLVIQYKNIDDGLLE